MIEYQLEATEPVTQAPTLTPVNEYLTNTTRFSEGWHQYSRTLLSQLSRNQLPDSAHYATKLQALSMAKRTAADVTPRELALYNALRETAVIIPKEPQDDGSEPRKMSDQRLLIEICILTGNVDAARVLIEYYPNLACTIGS